MSKVATGEAVDLLRKSYCEYIGVELEGWSLSENADRLPSVEGGIHDFDAGKFHCEKITMPRRSVAEAYEILRTLDAVDLGITYAPFRPIQALNGKGVWRSKPRYKVVRTALKRESPKTAHGVNAMTENAALQVNVSGAAIDPFGPAGVFLVNFWNDIAPYYAAQVHKAIGMGYGHFAIWKPFGRPERFPMYGRWFATPEEMVQYIESVPRLVRFDETHPVPNPKGEFQSITNRFDLSFMWWAYRPKLPDPKFGKIPYAEIRTKPSMPLALAEQYTQLDIDMLDVLMDWFYGPNCGQSVETVEAAVPAYRVLHEAFGDVVPWRPLSADEWHLHFYL